MNEISRIFVTLLGVVMILSGFIVTLAGIIQISPYELNIFDWLVFLGGLLLLGLGNSLCKMGKYACSTKIMFVEAGLWFLVLLNLSILLMIASHPKGILFLALTGTLVVFSIYWKHSKQLISERVRKCNLWF